MVRHSLLSFTATAGWLSESPTANVTTHESFTALELAVHTQLQDTLGLPDDQFTIYRNESAQPGP